MVHGYCTLQGIFPLSFKNRYLMCLQDYGIDFDDNDHPVEAFQCRCASKFCRNMKRSNSKFVLNLYEAYGCLEYYELQPICACTINVCMASLNTLKLGKFEV